MALDDALLQEFMQGFYGYGNLSAPCWFIGMEEGGGSSADDIAMRLETWKQRGKQEVDDLVDYHHDIGETRFFADPPKLQSTWKQLIRVYLSIRKIPNDDETMRRYQRSRFARAKGDTCLLELLPLPSPNVSGWLYGEHSSLPYLRTRDTYRTHMIPTRIAHLRANISRHRPKLVLFYGATYKSWWEEIALADLKPLEDASHTTLIGSHAGTVFTLTPHPSAHGITNQYFETLGTILRKKINEVK